MIDSTTYVAKLKQRAKDSHVYRKFQLMGLEISQILGDEKHKALYIKLAQQGDADDLMRIAKDVAERRNVSNKGAYFMKIVSENAKLVKAKMANTTATIAIAAAKTKGK